MKTTEAIEKVGNLSEQIKHFLLEIGYTAEGVEVDKNNPDENLINDELFVLAFELEDILTQIKYMSSPIMKEGNLVYKNNHFFIDKTKLESETIIEVLINDTWQKLMVYEVNSIQSIDGASQLEIENKKVRLREQPGDLYFYYRDNCKNKEY